MIRGTKTEKIISHLLLAVAAAAMLATSDDEPIIPEVSSGIHGRISLTPEDPVARFELRVAASAAAVDHASDQEQPWSGTFEYELAKPSDGSPGISYAIVSLPRSEELPEIPPDSPYTEDAFPRHHVACDEGQPCIRSYEVVFRLGHPRSAGVSVQWAALVRTAFPDRADQGKPPGASITIAAPDVPSKRGGDLNRDLDASGPLESVWLHNVQASDVPLRFYRPSRGASAPIKVTSAVHEPTEGIRITLEPEDETSPTIRIPLAGTTVIDPFDNCPRSRCSVGYIARIRPTEQFISDATSTDLRFTSMNDRVEVLPGGLIFESSPSQITKVVNGVAGNGDTVPVDARIGNFELEGVPEGAPVEMEGLFEAKLVSGPEPATVYVSAQEGQLSFQLDRKRRGDRFTFPYVERCTVKHTYPISPPSCWDDLWYDGAGSFEVSASDNNVKLHWRLTVRIRFPTLDKAPRGIALEVGING